MTREELVCLIHNRRRLRAMRVAARSSPGGARCDSFEPKISCILHHHPPFLPCSAGSSDSISVSGDENLEPDIGSLDLSWSRGQWDGNDWSGSSELFDDMWSWSAGNKKARAGDEF
jgi:hypothetical protein